MSETIDLQVEVGTPYLSADLTFEIPYFSTDLTFDVFAPEYPAGPVDIQPIGTLSLGISLVSGLVAV